MKKQTIHLIVLLFLVLIMAAGCGKTEQTQKEREGLQSNKEKEENIQKPENTDVIIPTSEIVSLEDGLAVVQYSGDYKLDKKETVSSFSFGQN